MHTLEELLQDQTSAWELEDQLSQKVTGFISLAVSAQNTAKKQGHATYESYISMWVSNQLFVSNLYLFKQIGYYLIHFYISVYLLSISELYMYNKITHKKKQKRNQLFFFFFQWRPFTRLKIFLEGKYCRIYHHLNKKLSWCFAC